MSRPCDAVRVARGMHSRSGAVFVSPSRAGLFRLLRVVPVAVTASIFGCSHPRAPDPPIPPAAPWPPARAYDASPSFENEDDAWFDEEAAVSDDDPSGLVMYEDELEPYGAWVDDPTWGTVWIPSVVVVGSEFVPYKTAGRWAVDDDNNWVWVSDYGWGDIPFHYGRWVWLSERRVWAWIPGRVYAPAWVVWRVGDAGYDYIGWSPMPPAWCWYDGFASVCYGRPLLAFWFVPSVYLFHVHWHRYLLPPHHAHVIARHTHVHPRHRYRPPRVGAHLPPRGVRATFQPASPSFTEANVPREAVPKTRVKSHPAVTPGRKATRTPGLVTPTPSRRDRSTAPYRSTPRERATPSRSPVPRERVTAPPRTRVTPSAPKRQNTTAPRATPSKKTTPRPSPKPTPSRKATPSPR